MDLRSLLRVEPTSGPASAGLLALRIVTGIGLMFHGWKKIQNPFGWKPDSSIPGVFQLLAAVSEFGGGLAFALGLLTPVAAFGVLCTMAVAASTHIAKGDPFIAPGRPSYELALLYLAAALTLLGGGPGRLSLDAVLFGIRARRGERETTGTA